MLILAVESSAAPSSCALLKDGVIIADMRTNVKLTHSQTLMPMVENMLKITNTNIGDIDVFAVSHGPGSFTGTRIGIAAVKGMALSYEKNCVGLSTLEVIANNIPYFSGIICSVMDARREQVYNALFECKGDGLCRITDDRAISIDTLGQEIGNLTRPCILVGDGAALCYNNLGQKYDNLFIAPANLRYQNAAAAAQLALNYYNRGQTVSAAELNPVYLRLPQAQRELLEKKRAGSANG